MMDQLLAIFAKYGIPPDQAQAYLRTMGGDGQQQPQQTGMPALPVNPGQPQTQDGNPIGIPGFPSPPGPTPIPPGQDPREYFLRQTPGYNWAFGEGQRAVQTSAAARGTLLTGGTLKALARYGQGHADQLYGSQLDRYGRLAELGQRTAVAPY